MSIKMYTNVQVYLMYSNEILTWFLRFLFTINYYVIIYDFLLYVLIVYTLFRGNICEN